MKRRDFIRAAACGAAALPLVTSCTPAEQSGAGATAAGNSAAKPNVPDYPGFSGRSFIAAPRKGANDTVVLALIGAGGFGTKLTLDTMALNANVQFKYVCDVDDTRGGRALAELEKAQEIKPQRVRDMRRVLEDKEVDGVIIATPQHWHALATIWACQAGKDVYVEKCVSHNIFEGQQMVRAAMKYGRVVQCGLQNRSAEYVQSARDYIRSGELGELISVHLRQVESGPRPFNEKPAASAPDSIDWDLWLGPAPKVPYSVSRNKSWGYYWDYSGGLEMGNGIIHQLDMTRLILGDPGHPRSVCCVGGRYFFDDQRDVPDYQLATLDYGKFTMTLETGACAPYLEKAGADVRLGDAFPDWMQNAERVLIMGTKRMMYVGRMGGGWQVYEKGGKIAAQQSGLYPLPAHLRNYVDCIRSRKMPNSNIAEGHRSAVLVHLANLSHRAGNKQLIFSGEHELILNDEKAQTLARGVYRKGFEVGHEV